MNAKAITKIVFLVIMTICVIIAVFSKFIVNGRNKKNGAKMSTGSARLILRIRMICFVIMLVCLLICVVL